MEQQDMITACTSGDVLISTDQKAEAVRQDTCPLQHVCCRRRDHSLKMFCLIIIQAVVFKKADDTDINFTELRLEECVYVAS